MTTASAQASTNVVAIRFRLQYPDVETFIAKYATNISEGGIFLASLDPPEVGSQVRFELIIADSLTLLHGEGEVVWIAPFDPMNPMAVCGMSLRFSRLDAEGQQLIARVLQYKADHPERFVTPAPDPYASVAYRPNPPVRLGKTDPPAAPLAADSIPTPEPAAAAPAPPLADVSSAVTPRMSDATPPTSTLTPKPSALTPKPSTVTPKVAAMEAELAELLKPRSPSSVTPNDASRRLSELLDRRLRPSRT